MNALADREGWRAEAACVGRNPVLFFPPEGSTDAGEAGKAVCRDCLVIAECLAFALTTRSVGVWGGTTEEERQRMVRNGRAGNLSGSRICAWCSKPFVGSRKRRYCCPAHSQAARSHQRDEDRRRRALR